MSVSVSIKYTPNPNSVQFFVEKEWISFCFECKVKSDCIQSPLLQSLWDIQGIVYMLVGTNFIVINKDFYSIWDNLIPKIINVLSDFLIKYDYIFPVSKEELKRCIEQVEMKKNVKEFTGLELKINELLKEKVRPALELHGGGVRLIELNRDELVLELLGACVGCPSSMETVQFGVLQLLQYYFPEIKTIKIV